MRRITLRGQPVAGGKVPLVCTPLVGRTREAIRSELEAVLAKGPDLVEWRADFFEGLAEVDEVLAVARLLRQAAGPRPIVFTRRARHEGGEAVSAPEERVVEIYRAVCESGSCDVVDYELSHPPERFAEVRRASREHGVAMIGSHHDFAATPPAEELFARFQAAERAGADIAKVAVMPRRLDDVLALLGATLEASREVSIPLISMSMGAYGSLTRMFGWVFGSAVTFAVGQGSSAPGQLAIEDLNRVVEVVRRALSE
jgi:3-dehydroquinate dehydratase I